MSLTLATVLTLCTFATCNDYAVDTATTRTDATANLERISDEMADAWAIKDSDKALKAFLAKYNIEEDTQFILDYDFTTQAFTEDDIP